MRWDSVQKCTITTSMLVGWLASDEQAGTPESTAEPNGDAMGRIQQNVGKSRSPLDKPSELSLQPPFFSFTFSDTRGAHSFTKVCSQVRIWLRNEDAHKYQGVYTSILCNINGVWTWSKAWLLPLCITSSISSGGGNAHFFFPPNIFYSFPCLCFFLVFFHSFDTFSENLCQV